MTAIGSTSYYRSSVPSSGTTRSNADAENGLASSPPNSHKAGSSASQPSVNSAPSTAALNFQGRLLSADLKAINVAGLPAHKYQEFMEGEERRLEANKRYLENQYADTDWTATVEASLKAFPPTDTPATKPYATIMVGGKVVATIDNQGVVASSDELGKKLKDMLLGDVNGTNGPDLAQARAEQIAELLGGRVVKSETAITQGEFNALPSLEQRQPPVDYEAMKNDPMYDQLQNMIARLDSLKQQRKTL